MSLPNTISPVSPFDVILSATTNDIIENIEALAAGTGLDANAVSADKLATSAIALGYTQITSNFATANQTATQVTGLSASVTIPAGGRRVRVTAFAPVVGVNAVAANNLGIWDGTVGSGTLLVSSVFTSAGTSYVSPMIATRIHTPSAGAKTYNVSYHVQNNTGTISVSANSPAYILVEAI